MFTIGKFVGYRVDQRFPLDEALSILLACPVTNLKIVKAFCRKQDFTVLILKSIVASG